MANVDEIKAYWDEQAAKYGSNPNATTNDIFLRKIEINYLCEFLESFDKKLRVLDIGCGNGYSTFEYKKKVPKHDYVGADYSEEMIKSAKERLLKENITGITFEVMDVTQLSLYNEKFDLIISDRCLVNLGNSGNRKKAIKEICRTLNSGGKYLMIENFIEGHIEFNKLREWIGLPEINVRWHNSFFSKDELNESIKNYFEIKRFENISSLYYLVTRVVYSKVCLLEGREPDYDNIIYQVASELPPIGNFGPTCACLLEKSK